MMKPVSIQLCIYSGFGLSFFYKLELILHVRTIALLYTFADIPFYYKSLA